MSDTGLISGTVLLTEDERFGPIGGYDGYNSYDSMGEFYYNEGDMENALKFYKKAKEMYPAATSANLMIEEISKS